MNKLIIKASILLTFLSGFLSGGLLEGEQLVTIHGIFGSPWNMHHSSASLKKGGMDVMHWGYPSRDKKILEHAEDLVFALQEKALLAPGKAIHFITHSMGGLILRAALNHPDCPPEAQIGKAVLLAPPNQGSAWGRLLAAFSIAHCIGKDMAGKELMTELDFEHLGQFPLSMDVMVIAGNFSINFLIDGENDGTVAVKETYLSTPHHHRIIWQEHKSILFSKDARYLIEDFFIQQLD